MQSISSNLPSNIIKNLLPSKPLIPEKNIWDSIKPKGNNLINNLLPSINKMKMDWFQLKLEFVNGRILREDQIGHEYSKYLEYPSIKIKNLINTITEMGDSNDVKAEKILLWVQDNIEYKTDLKNYNMSEWWTTPSQTLRRESGDCEDGAFLIHSMLLNAGISWEKIRTYGGSVFAGEGAQTGGHAWTSYQREIDDEWVVLDWCYFPNQKPVAERMPMSEDIRYIDDWFYIDTHAYVETPITNKVRNPMSAYDWSPRREFIKGQRINYTA